MDATPTLPAATRPQTVRLQVSDLQRSLHWYTATLGCRVLDVDDDTAVLGVAGDPPTPLILLAARPGTRAIAPHARLGLYHFAILLPSRAALGGFVRRLAALDLRVASADHLVSEALYLTDPDGLGVEVYADRPRDSWTWSGGHVLMTVDRLDLRDLARAATDPWDGLPAGTTLGHVHLHVGQLDEAAAFYQDGLGLAETARLPGARFLAAGGYHHHLGINAWAAAAPPPGPDDAQLLEWTLHVPDPQASDDARARLEAQGVACALDSDTRAWSAADPWGTHLRVVT